MITLCKGNGNSECCETTTGANQKNTFGKHLDFCAWRYLLLYRIYG